MAATLLMGTTTAKAEVNDNDSIYGFTTEQAHHAEGDAVLMIQLADRLELEDSALPESGRTVIKAIVEKDGRLVSQSVSKTCGQPDIDTAVMKAVNQLPPFVPAKNGDEVVRSYTYIPAVYPSIRKIKQQLAEARAREVAAPAPKDNNNYFRIETPKYLIGEKSDTIAYTIKYTPSTKENATHVERIIHRGDTTRIQKVSLTTNKVTDEDVRIRGMFTSNRIYDKAGNLICRVSPSHGGEGVKIRHYRNGQKVREYDMKLNGPTNATFFDQKGEVTAKYVYNNKQDTKEEEVFIVVEKMPQFPGGQEALFRFLGENVKYPVEAQKAGHQGRVICQFIVDKDGSITNVEVVRSSGDASLDKEAMRLIRSMPKWTPGKQRGKTVRVKYTVPVNFRLQ